MIPVKCESPPCKSSLMNFRSTFYVFSLESPCPSCGLRGHLQPCEFIHLIIPDKFGTLVGQNNERYQFLCPKAKAAFLSSPLNPEYPKFYSPVIAAVTCPECLKLYGAKELNGEFHLFR
jgi:hypothetical protein